MRSDLQIAREQLSPPGETIQETLDTIGMSQVELAGRMGRPKEKINDLIRGRDPLTTATAFQLEKVLGIPADFWLNREKEYRRKLYEIEQEEVLEECVSWLQEFPIRELKQLEVLTPGNEKKALASELLSFFSVVSPKQWNQIYIENEVAVAFRISLANTQSPHAMSAWLRMGELEAKRQRLPVFDKKGFRDSLDEIKELAFIFPVDFADRLKQICAKSGVAVAYVPNLPKAPISGATRWFQNTPLIQLSGRYKYDDHFWFTFFHEAGHILLHGKKDVFLEDVKGTPVDEKKEEEADDFASKWLLNESELNSILEFETLTDELIIEYSEKFRTPPGIIIGRLQHNNVISFSQGNHLRNKVTLFT